MLCGFSTCWRGHELKLIDGLRLLHSAGLFPLCALATGTITLRIFMAHNELGILGQYRSPSCQVLRLLDECAINVLGLGLAESWRTAPREMLFLSLNRRAVLKAD